MRKTFFSILVSLHSLVTFSQFKQDTTILYPDCIQISPLFLIEPYSSCLNLSLEHRFNCRTYGGFSLGFFFNPTGSANQTELQSQSGFRLSFELRKGLSKRCDAQKRISTTWLIGAEPYFKYIRSERVDHFLDYEYVKKNDEFNTFYYRDSLSLEKLYTLERMQAGLIIKTILKHTHGLFNLDIELGGRCFYKIVDPIGIQKELDFYTGNRHDMFSWDYLRRYDGWALRPFLNIRIGRRF